MERGSITVCYHLSLITVIGNYQLPRRYGGPRDVSDTPSVTVLVIDRLSRAVYEIYPAIIVAILIRTAG